MSARNSSDAFDLRCYVRENLLKYISENMPEHLPQKRYQGWEKEDQPKEKMVTAKDKEKS
jgi:hypothetical protein